MSSISAPSSGTIATEFRHGEAACLSAWEMMELISERAKLSPCVAGYVVIDRFSRSYRHGAPIKPGIRDAREILLRFDTGMQNPTELAAQPQSIVVSEFSDHYVISRTVSAHPLIDQVMSTWVDSLQRAVGLNPALAVPPRHSPANREPAREAVLRGSTYKGLADSE